MKQMDAFEQQLATVARQVAGPVRPVDAMVVTRSAKAGRAPAGMVHRRWFRGGSQVTATKGGFSMFSAVKFVVAAVIVALFGGFLLAGILNNQQANEVAPAAATESPSPPEELLSRMVTEEVEPGVVQVINDGARDLTTVGASGVVAGYDGGIWLLRDDEFLRLGSERSHAWPVESASYEARIFEVGPDGTMWIIEARHAGTLALRGDGVLRSTDGEVWVSQPCPQACGGLTVAPDGEVWASWHDEGGYQVGHLGSAGWEPINRPIAPVGDIIFDRLYLTDTGDLYATFVAYGPHLDRYENGAWSEVSYFSFDGILDIGRDGTVWQSGGTTLLGQASDGTDIVLSELNEGLARFADGEWTWWTPADLPDVALSTPPDDDFRVAPDGSLWVSSSCDGIVRFDGMTTDHFLPGRCISMDIAADGSVWALADNADGRDLYVITREAVAGSPES